MIKVLPDYDGGSILNLSSSIAKHFGLDSGFPPLRQELPFEDAERVILLIADGLGQLQLERHITDGDAPNIQALLEQGALQQSITSVFPSTTMSAVTSLHMAAPPATTGWLGYTIWLEEAGCVTDMITQSNFETGEKLEQPDFLKSYPSLSSRLEKLGVQCIAVQPSEYRGSFLNQWYWQGAYQAGYLTANTIPSIISSFKNIGQPQYICAYYPYYDTVCHKFGPSSSQASDEVAALDLCVARVLKSLPKNGKTIFILVADHGQRDLDPKKVVHLEQDKILRSMLRGAPAGERLSRTFRAQPDSLSELETYLAPYAQTMPSSQAWDSGLFGNEPAKPAFRTRVGDLLAVPLEGIQFCWSYPGRAISSAHLGSHGGWSEAEMLVPLIALRL